MGSARIVDAFGALHAAKMSDIVTRPSSPSLLLAAGAAAVAGGIAMWLGRRRRFQDLAALQGQLSQLSTAVREQAHLLRATTAATAVLPAGMALTLHAYDHCP